MYVKKLTCNSLIGIKLIYCAFYEQKSFVEEKALTDSHRHTGFTATTAASSGQEP